MKKLCPAVLLLFGFSAAALFGADFWQKKKYSEWTPKDVQRMLTDSPWARPVELSGMPRGMGGGRGGGGGGGRRGGGGGGGGDFSAATSSMGSRVGEGGGDEPAGGPGGAPMRGDAPKMVVIVRLSSALPVKQALVRGHYGDAVLTSAEAAKFLAKQETHYIVSLSGLPVPMLGGDPKMLKDKALFTIKGKDPIAAQEVFTSGDQRRPDLYLMFPRAGNPVAVEDGEVEVRLALPNTKIKRTFKLKDLVYEGKLEL